MANGNGNRWHSKFKTLRHMETVRNYLNRIICELMNRGEQHDQSKLEEPECKLFDEVTSELRGLVYGTPEYQASLDRLDPALKHHYANNRHHPQHFPDGITDMTLIDILEMVADWKASSHRQDTGNILHSLAENKERFGISDQLFIIIQNTMEWFDLVSVYHKGDQS